MQIRFRKPQLTQLITVALTASKKDGQSPPDPADRLQDNYVLHRNSHRLPKVISKNTTAIHINITRKIQKQTTTGLPTRINPELKPRSASSP